MPNLRKSYLNSRNCMRGLLFSILWKSGRKIINTLQPKKNLELNEDNPKFKLLLTLFVLVRGLKNKITQYSKQQLDCHSMKNVLHCSTSRISLANDITLFMNYHMWLDEVKPYSSTTINS